MTETVSPPGRVTWHGTCAHEGCTKSVYAKRVPKDAQPPAVDGAQQPADPEEEGSVKEVRFDVPQPKRKQHGEPRVHEPAPAADPGAGDEQQQSVHADTLAQPLELGDKRAEPEPAPGGRSELVDKRAGRPVQQRPRRKFRHPLDW